MLRPVALDFFHIVPLNVISYIKCKTTSRRGFNPTHKKRNGLTEGRI